MFRPLHVIFHLYFLLDPLGATILPQDQLRVHLSFGSVRIDCGRFTSNLHNFHTYERFLLVRQTLCLEALHAVLSPNYHRNSKPACLLT